MRKNGLIIIFILVIIVLSAFLFMKKNNDSLLLGDTKSISGDVDGNGKVNTMDYLLVRKHLLNINTLKGDQLKRADVNNDGKVSSADFIAIRKQLLGNSTNYSGSNNNTNTGKSQLAVYDSKYNYVVADFNVLDYDGVDPTGKDDSSGAFQKALDDAKACGTNHTCGGTVYVPPGTYRLSNIVQVWNYTSLIGSLEEGTTNGTVLLIDHDANSTDNNRSALIVLALGSVQNMAFVYPDQALQKDGSFIPYPPTITFGPWGTDGVTLENLNFVNSYIAMDFASTHENESIQFIRRIYGTPLHIGLINDTNYDTIKLEDINFSPKYWLNSKISSNKPTEAQLKQALKSKNNKAAGMVFQRIDWLFAANIKIEGYYYGFKFDQYSMVTPNGTEGEIFDSKITDCYYPMYIDYSKHLVITNTKLEAKGDNGAKAIFIDEDCDFDYSIFNSDISSNGDVAIEYRAKRGMSISNTKVNGRIYRKNASSPITLLSNSLTNTGYESCSTGTYQNISINKNYNKRVETKPKSKSIIKVIPDSNNDITSSIKNAIQKLQSTGGIVYIPRGVFKVTDNINVPSGIEIRGAVPWAHNRGYGISTVIQVTFRDKNVFTLQSNSGINGLDIQQPDNEDSLKEHYGISDPNTIKDYPYAIKGNGSNIYITNVTLSTIWNGIDLTGCDNHYVEHIWGEFFNIGINVDGGSKNGIIRDNHFQISTLANWTTAGVVKVLTEQVVIRVGNSSNEVLFNTFAFGPGVGYYFDNAKDFYVVGVGVDFGNTPVKISGSSTGKIINPMLVAKPEGKWTIGDPKNPTYVYNLGVPDISHAETYGAKCHYIETTSNYSGLVDIINSLNWGNPYGTGFVLAGTGDLHFTSGILENFASPAIITSNSAQTIAGMIIGPVGGVTKFQIEKGVWGISLVRNICIDGKPCSENMINNAGINVGYLEATTCNASTPNFVTSSEWENTITVNTSVTAKSATTKLCGFGTLNGTLEYKGNSTDPKTATISGDCATITINSGKGEIFYYRVKGTSEWKKVYDIGKYLIFGQIYNQLLYANVSVSNNSSNVGAWVKACDSVSECVKTISSEAVNIRTNDTSTDFASYIYKGVLGRGGDSEGVKAWAKAIDDGTPKMQIINGFINSTEAHEIYSAWGYN